MTRLMLIVGTIVALGLLAGCGDSEEPPGAAAPSTAAEPAAPAEPGTDAGTPTAPPETGTAPEPTASSEVTVFFADSQGALVAERYPGPVTLAGAVAALAEGPSDADLAPALPPGTRLLSARAEGGTAILDLSGEFAAGYPSGGAAAEIAVIGPLVFSATALPGVEAVLLTVEGAPPDLPGSQYDLTVPLVRADVGATVAEGS